MKTDLVFVKAGTAFVASQEAIDVAGEAPASHVRPPIWIALVHEYFWAATGHNLPVSMYHERDLHAERNSSAIETALALALATA